LRGPVGNLHALLEYLTDPDEEISQEEANKILHVSKGTAQATFELLENLLWWARSQKGSIRFKPEKGNLCELIESNIHLFSSSAKKKNIRVLNHCPLYLEFEFDRDMVRTILRNLLNNAIKYSHSNGKIDVSVAIQTNGVEISVKDSGVGMDDKTLGTLFDFQSHEKSRPGTDDEKGTGLGLVLCKDFVHRHGGTIEVESFPEKGSRFKIFLPS